MKKDVLSVAEKLHEWYLEASMQIKQENYNPKAQKEFKDLNKDQQFIDIYIAEKVIKYLANINK